MRPPQEVAGGLPGASLLLGVALDCKTAPGLRHGHQLKAIDVDVGRGVEHPKNSFGNVFWLNRFSPLIGGVIPRLVAAKAHHREFALAQARLNIADPHTCTLQITTQVQGKLLNKGFGTAIHMATRIRLVARNGTQVDDPCATSVSNQARKQQVSGVKQAFDIGVDHGFPIVELALRGRVSAYSQPGIVDKPA